MLSRKTSPESKEEHKPKYHGIGFGTNYFYSFGTDAIAFRDVFANPKEREQRPFFFQTSTDSSSSATDGERNCEDNKDDVQHSISSRIDEEQKYIEIPRGFFFPLHPNDAPASSTSNPSDLSSPSSSSPTSPITDTAVTTTMDVPSSRRFKRRHRRKIHRNKTGTSPIKPPNIFSMLRLSTPSSSFHRPKRPSSSSSHSNSSSCYSLSSVQLPYPSKLQAEDLPALSLGATFQTSLNNNDGQISLAGTLHGKIFPSPTIQRSHLPHLKCKQISCGRRHVLALFERNVTMSWGSGYFGQLGHGLDHVACETPTVVERLLNRAVGGNVVRVEAGGMHSAAIVLLDDGDCVDNVSSSLSWEQKCRRLSNPEGVRTKVFHWGSNRYGQCAVEGGKRNAVGFPLPMVDTYHPETGKRVSFFSLTLGKRHSVGLSLPHSKGSGGELYTWGSTASGRCGHGNLGSLCKSRAMSASLPKRVDALRNVNIVQVSAGDSHTLALSESGRVFSWGIGSSGQLGHGHIMQLLSPRIVADLEFGSQEGVRGGKEDGKRALSNAAEVNLSGSNSCLVDFHPHNEQDNVEKALDRNRPDSEAACGHTISPPTPHIHYPSTPPIKAAQACTNSSDAKACDLPKITRIRAAGSYSAAVDSLGDLYTWGCGDGEQLGHALPNASFSNVLPSIESGQPASPHTIGSPARVRESISFDSRLNVLIPRRVECIRRMGLKVEDVTLSTHCMSLICSESDVLEDHESFGMRKTLFE